MVNGALRGSLRRSARVGRSGCAGRSGRLRVHAAIGRTNVVAGSIISDRDAWGSSDESFLDQIDGHGDEGRVDPDRRGSKKRDSELFGFRGSFLVQVVEDLHVVGDKADGLDDHMGDLRIVVESFDSIADIGFEPGLLRWSGSALVDDFPVGVTDRFADESGGFSQLQFVARVVCHRFRDAVGREEHWGRGAMFGGDLVECRFQAIGLGFDELRVIETHPSFFNQGSFLAGQSDRSGDVLSVLAATAVATEHRGKESDGAFAAVVFHLGERIGEHGMPISVSPVDGQSELPSVQFGLDGPDQSAALFVDGADSAKVVVVFGDFEHSFAGHIFPPQDVFEEGHHVLGAFGAPEGDHQNRVDGNHIQRWKWAQGCRGGHGRDGGRLRLSGGHR